MSGLPAIPDNLLSRTEEEHSKGDAKELKIEVEVNASKHSIKAIPEDIGGEMTPIKKNK